MHGRPWYHHLRLLPGGDSDVWSAIIATGLLYVVLLIPGGILAAVLHTSLGSEVGPFSGMGLANGVPCMVIAMWTGLRVRGSKPIDVDEAAADLKRRRVYYGDEVARVPNDAVVFSIKPRQVSAEMADGRRLTLFFRVNSDPEDLLGLGRALKRHAGLAVEDYVHSHVESKVKELLPDPQGIRDAMTEELLRRGIVITRAEAV